MEQSLEELIIDVRNLAAALAHQGSIGPSLKLKDLCNHAEQLNKTIQAQDQTIKDLRTWVNKMKEP